MYTKKRVLRFYMFTLLFVVFSTNNLYSQNEDLYEIPDSLATKSNEYLLSQVVKNFNDTIKINTYLKTLLTKATIGNDTLIKISALNYLSQYESDHKQQIVLIEKAIAEARNIDHPIKINLQTTAGIINHEQYKYEEALQHYVEALDLSEKYDQNVRKHSILNNIALVKGDIGKHQEALSLHKEHLAYKVSNAMKDSLSIMVSKINLAESYRYVEKYDSASYYYNQVIDNPFDHYFFGNYRDIAIINEGINLFFQNEYSKSRELLHKGSSQIPFNVETEKYYILSQLYLGKVNLKLNNLTEAEDFFLKVDSLNTITDIFIPETRDAYEFFWKKYEKEKKLELQINTLNKLSSFDSIINTRKLNVSNKLHSEFDIPALLKNREAALQKLKDTNSVLSTRTMYLLIFIFLLILLFAFQYKKHKVYKKRFNELIAKPTLSQKSRKETSILNTKPPKEINIDEKIISKILVQLDRFEKNDLYLKRDTTVSNLAKDFSTNTRYLSKVINVYKQKKFINYINDLRIDYIVKELKTNTTLQRYTIKSIGEEAGFNNSESFSTAFKKKTGIKPSYFIKNLTKK